MNRDAQRAAVTATTTTGAAAPTTKKKRNKPRRQPREKEPVPDTIERFKKAVACVKFVPEVSKPQGFDLLDAWGIKTSCVVAVRTSYYLCTNDDSETTRLLAALEARFDEQEKAVGEDDERPIESVQLASLPPYKCAWHCTLCDAIFVERPAAHQRYVHSERVPAVATPPAHLLSPEDVATRSKRYVELHEIVERIEELHRSQGDGARQAALRAVEYALRRVYPSGRVHQYGSFVTGLWDETSDMDLVVEVPGAADPVPVLSRFLKSMRGVERQLKPFILRKARVPLVHLAFTATGVECDVTCNNMNGCHNSALIRDYTTYDARVLPYLLLVRAWGKRTGVINSKQGFLTPYALVVLALVFVQAAHAPPLVPLATSPALVARARAGEPGLELRHLADGFDYVHDHTWRTACRAAPEELFHAFLVYYGYTFDFARDALDAHDGRVGPKAAVAPGFGTPPIVARDPFLRDFNMCKNINENAARFIVFNFRESAHAIAENE